MQDGFYKSRIADLAFAPYQLAAFGAADDHVTPATGPNVPLAGVGDSLPVNAGDLVDVQMTQIADVQCGATVAAGDRLMSDANGNVVTAVKQAGATVYLIAIAQRSGVAGDVIPALITYGAIIG